MSLLLNGRKLEGLKEFSIPNRKHRLTILSSSYLPYTTEIEAAQLEHLDPHLIPFVKGKCQQAKIHKAPDADLENIYTFFNPRCVKSWNSPNSPKDEQDTSSYSLPKVQSISLEKPSTPFYKKTWFWVATSAVLVGVAYSIYENQQKQSAPAQTQTIHHEGL